MEKKVLSEQSLYYGNIDMPKGFEINQKKLVSNILKEKFTNKESIFSRDWDMLNTYIRDHIRLEYSFNLIEKKSFGDIYKPSELSKPLLNVDLVDLRNSPDFTMLYGIKVDKCWVKIYFDDNRRKGKSYDIELKNNMFIMFPSTNMYYITNKKGLYQ